MKFNEKIVYLRQLKEITQKEASKALLISKSTLSRMERGIQKPSCDDLVKLSKFYNVSIDYLLDNEGRTGCKVKKIITLLHEQGLCEENMDIDMLRKIFLIYKILKA